MDIPRTYHWFSYWHAVKCMWDLIIEYIEWMLYKIRLRRSFFFFNRRCRLPPTMTPCSSFSAFIEWIHNSGEAACLPFCHECLDRCNGHSLSKDEPTKIFQQECDHLLLELLHMTVFVTYGENPNAAQL
jgi:hypothetical protein